MSKKNIKNHQQNINQQSIMDVIKPYMKYRWLWDKDKDNGEQELSQTIFVEIDATWTMENDR